MFVITLSSIPPRFNNLEPVLTALTRQDSPADHVILYIPKRYRRFPDYDGALPLVPKGVEIRQPEEDFGPASKVLHAVRDFAHIPDADLLFCDDDRIYRPDWATQFHAARTERTEEALCASGWDLSYIGMGSDAERHVPHYAPQARSGDWGYRRRKLCRQIALRRLRLEVPDKPWRSLIRKSGFVDAFEGYGGVMVQPRFFDEDAFDIPEVLWAVDDVWLSGICTKNGHRCWAIAGASRFTHTPSRHVGALNTAVIEGADRQMANRLCARYMQKTYGIWGGLEAG